MFDTKWMKILKADFNTLKQAVLDLQEENAELKEKQSEFLMGVVKRQGAEIKKLLKYKEQDDTLYSYEQTNEEQKQEIARLKQELAEAKGLTDNYKNAYQLESNMSDMLIERVVSNKKNCPQYETADISSILDVRG